MIVARTIAELNHQRRSIGSEKRVAFVPTMGALHAGHRSLIRLARSSADVVVVSIFVNPLQFGPNEDYTRYPRPLEDDLAICRADDVDLVFVPSVADLYPAARSVSVSAGPMGASFEGRSRPGHFDGVLTVVLKLFNLVGPEVAIFGQKDAQQLALIRRMVFDLNLGVQIIAAPVVRDSDGLAVSSRNAYLTPAERSIALSLSAALQAGAAQTSVAASEAAARSVLATAEADPSFALDYLALVHPETFTPVAHEFAGEAWIIVAARVGRTRLIDNAIVTLTGGNGDGSVVAPGSADRPQDRKDSAVAASEPTRG
jgi:pantoate--beta-alanine ligase